MPSTELDPGLPADNSPIVSAELRMQFQSILDRFNWPNSVAMLQMSVSNPPTQAQVQAIANKIDELIFALQGG